MSTEQAGDGGTRIRVWHKVRAVLAAGIVLGLGTTGTLAQFTDSVYSQGTIRSGQFAMQANPRYQEEGTQAWGDYSSADTPAFFVCKEFPSGRDTAVGIVPGESAYCPVSLRLGRIAENNNVPRTSATVTMSGPPSTGNTLADALRYTVRKIAGFGTGFNDRGQCREEQWDKLLPVSGFPENDPLATGLSLTLNANNVDESGSGYTNLCFQILLPLDAPTAALGQSTGPITWQFEAAPIR